MDFDTSTNNTGHKDVFATTAGCQYAFEFSKDGALWVSLVIGLFSFRKAADYSGLAELPQLSLPRGEREPLIAKQIDVLGSV